MVLPISNAFVNDNLVFGCQSNGGGVVFAEEILRNNP